MTGQDGPTCAHRRASLIQKRRQVVPSAPSYSKFQTPRETLATCTGGGGGSGEGDEAAAKMIYDVNSPLFRSFLSQKGGASSDKRKMEEQKPKEQRPKASENKPVMNE
ncbi:uncharacterized protein LOC107305465 [Oryza brachyantha]|nr:uncharacterized protein LOC107305465 [Oryza brachyantha]